MQDESIIIPLTQGKSMTIDVSDAHLFDGVPVYAVRYRNRWAAASRGVAVHRIILGLPKGHWCGARDNVADWIVHHKDGDGLNNRRSNLQMMRRDEHGKLHKPTQTPKRKTYWGVEREL